jgi:hypothetical protein
MARKERRPGDLPTTSPTLFRRVGVSLLKPALRGALSFVDEKRLLDGLLKADSKDRSATSRYLDTVSGLLEELGLEKTLFYALWLSLARSAREDEAFYAKIHEALLRGAREWKGTQR